MGKPKWLRKLLGDQYGRLTEREYKQMMAANTQTLPVALSFQELNAGRVITGEMPDPSGILGDDGDEIREARGKFIPGTREPALYTSPAFKRQLELEREWSNNHGDMEAAADLNERVKGIVDDVRQAADDEDPE